MRPIVYPRPKPSFESLRDAADIIYEKKTWNVDDLKGKIQASPSSFTRFKVVRITHVKDLANWVWHEYIQIIVRDSDTSNLLRLITERQTDNDHVVIGMWKVWKEGTTPPDGSGDTKFPLALFTLEFNNNPVPLQSFVELLSAIHALHPQYTVYAANCYWYALAVYDNLYVRYKATASEKKWTWWFYRYLPPTYIAWWDLVTVPLMDIAAASFKRDDMKDKDNPKYRRIDGEETDIRWNLNIGRSHKPDTLAVQFWLAIQQKVSKEFESSLPALDIPTLRTGTWTAEQIEAKLPEPEKFSNIPNPVLYPGEDTHKPYQFTEQVHDVCKDFLQHPLLDKYIKKADEREFDQLFTPLKADNTPPECEEMLNTMGPEWRLTKQHCDDLNTAMKACVGAVQMRLDEG